MLYTIQNENSKAQIDTKGGELVSFVQDNREYIWTGDSTYWNGHNPILFPVIGFLKDNQYILNGKPYPLVKHGFARKSEFELLSIQKDKIVLQIQESAETLARFPFSFVFQVTHQMLPKGFSTTFSIRNTGEGNMYFHIGGHTGFCLPFSASQKFSDHKLIFDQKECADRYIAPEGILISEIQKNYLNHEDTLPLDYSLFDRDALILGGLKSRGVTLCDQLGKGVHVDFHDFSILGIWTPPKKNAPFLCIEPWNGMNAFENETGDFSEKPFIVSLEPQKQKDFSYTVTIL